ncbi:MAG: MTH938/NDUFAF3 family protein [Candidatus Nanoarchaeia archaeon]|nr:MTH938/NDUFAF3 family protein [Candidatus Nanoarchaeia archaeon]
MIESYKFGKITIEGTDYMQDLILTSTKVIKNWQREEGHLLKAADLKQAMKESPKILIIGTGYEGCMKLDSSVEYICQRHGIKLIVQKTKEAVSTFNSMKEPGVVAVLHLTC